ncbi:MAG: choice-of-anchor V domain-containing protein [Pseudomonadota bacterium]
MRLAGASLIGFGLICATPVAAHPDGAPWGSADPVAAENCASCHFDNDAVHDSDLISSTGWRPLVRSGDQFEFRLLFQNRPYAFVGMQVMASVGTFEAEQDELEAYGAQIRSNAVVGGVGGWNMWRFVWTAPESVEEPITFHFAVNKSNNDQSALGDQIHFRTLTLYPDITTESLPPLR